MTLYYPDISLSCYISMCIMIQFYQYHRNFEIEANTTVDMRLSQGLKNKALSLTKKKCK